MEQEKAGKPAFSFAWRRGCAGIALRSLPAYGASLATTRSGWRASPMGHAGAANPMKAAAAVGRPRK